MGFFHRETLSAIEYARRQREYPKMYAEEIKKFIGDTSALNAHVR